ncbi:MAG: hypothetical protein ACXWXT_08085, partial [Candidatus Binatia bacterium]
TKAGRGPSRKHGKVTFDSMNELICQEILSLLAITEDLLNCPDPSLEVWEGYALRRNAVFQRLWDLPMCTEDIVADSPALQPLMTSVLEKDQVLVQKIGQQLSNISREMIELSDRRRVFNAYARIAQSMGSYHHRTA